MSIKKMPKSMIDTFVEFSKCGYHLFKGTGKEIATIHRETKQFGAATAIRNSLARREKTHYTRYLTAAGMSATTLAAFLWTGNPACGYIALVCGVTAVAERVLAEIGNHINTKITNQRMLDQVFNGTSQSRE